MTRLVVCSCVSNPNDLWVAGFMKSLTFILQKKLGIAVSECFIDSYEYKNINDAIAVIFADPEYFYTGAFQTQLAHKIKYFGNGTKVFVVRKTPVEIPLFPELKTKFPYNLFSKQVDNNNTSFTTLNASNDYYWLMLTLLAQDIQVALNLYEVKEYFSKAVFIAPTSEDQCFLRSMLELELKDIGCKVYPSKPLPNAPNHKKAMIEDLLSKSSSVIQIFGQEYAENIDFQSKVIGDYLINNPTSCESFCWLPKIDFKTPEKQKIFIQDLNRDPQFLSKTQLIKGEFEVFKKTVRDLMLSLQA